MPIVKSSCAKYERVDIIFYVYRKGSLKAETRSKRERGLGEEYPNQARHLRIGKALCVRTKIKQSFSIFLQKK